MLQINAELHCHTTYSDGFASPKNCVRWAARKGLQVLAITDHNTAEGGLPYWDNPLQDGVLVIPGEEISTEIGHVLAYFVRETISPGPFEQVIAQIRSQNALAFMAHPYHIPLGNRWRRKEVFKLAPEQLSLLDGIEVENGHNRGAANRMAWTLAQNKHLTALSGSDAHHPMEIGNGRCQLEVSELSHPAVRAALLDKNQVRPQPRRWNAYGVYLLMGVLNKITKKKYAWKPEVLDDTISKSI